MVSHINALSGNPCGMGRTLATTLTRFPRAPTWKQESPGVFIVISRFAMLRFVLCAASLCAAFAVNGTASLAQSTLAPANQAGAAAGDATKVTATGTANLYATDTARSRDEAIEAARRDAVEQVSGVFIQSESEMKNFDLVKDEVLSRTQGYVRNTKVVKEGAANNLYTVTIEAEVVKAAFLKQMNDSLEELYRRVGKPRVMLLVKEFKSDNDPSNASDQGVAAREVRKILLAQGFTFVDPRIVTRTQLSEVAKGKAADKNAFVAIGQATKAEIVMIGEVHTSSKEVMNRFQRVQAEMSMDVVKTDNGQVMASQTSSATDLHIDAATATTNALQKVATEITPKLAQQISYQWIKDKNEGASIELTVKGASYGDLAALRRALSNEVRGVKGVTQRSFSGGTALLVLTTRDTADRVAESLSEAKFGNFSLDIDDVTPTSLIVTLKKR